MRFHIRNYLLDEGFKYLYPRMVFLFECQLVEHIFWFFYHAHLLSFSIALSNLFISLLASLGKSYLSLLLLQFFGLYFSQLIPVEKHKVPVGALVPLDGRVMRFEFIFGINQTAI